MSRQISSESLIFYGDYYTSNIICFWLIYISIKLSKFYAPKFHPALVCYQLNLEVGIRQY